MEAPLSLPSLTSESDAVDRVLIRRHIVTGWWSLLFFATLGFLLEVFHGFKIDLYLNLTQETRRLMWTLAHAHGTLLSLVQIAFAFSVSAMRVSKPHSLRRASRLLLSGGMLIPVGFFAGGVVTHGGDPGVGILLVPVGAICLIVGAALAARGFSSGC